MKASRLPFSPAINQPPPTEQHHPDPSIRRNIRLGTFSLKIHAVMILNGIIICLLVLLLDVTGWISVSRVPHRSKCALQQSFPPLFATPPASLKSLIMETLDDQRNVPSLERWALEKGVALAEGVKLVDNGLGDWGVGLSENHTQVAQTPIMTIPKDLILTSADPLLEDDLRSTISESMTLSSMEYYVPECLLMTKVLWEKAKGKNSNTSSEWSPWLDTLPKSFQTGIYMNPMERSLVERLAPEFLEQQTLQWQACRTALNVALEKQVLPKELHEYLANQSQAEQDELIKWAFSVVFTRSWRTPNSSKTTTTPFEATLVPLGDMFNHDSVMANVYPNIVPENGSIQMKVKRNVEPGSPLYLSYGMGNLPGRFLVNFGFWDRSADYMDANLTIPSEGYPIDRSQLVVSTRNGGVTEDVWDLGIYQLLRQRDPIVAERFANAQRNQDERTLQEIRSQYDLEGALYLRLHALKLIGETYPEMDIAPAVADDGNTSSSVMDSPRRFGMIARYNNGMRESWRRVADYLDDEINEALLKRKKTS
eukprot:scaffold871_cov130-Cylindrotheca_fusiformis.AAC.12